MSSFIPVEGRRREGGGKDHRQGHRNAARTGARGDIAGLVSSVGGGMLVTGKVISPGILQIFGCVTGEINAGQLVVCDGGSIDGTIIAQDAVIQGAFKGKIYGNTVKLQNSAVVEGEIFNRWLTIEEDAQFEGVSRRLDRPVDAPPVGETDEPTVAAPAAQADPIFEPAA